MKAWIVPAVAEIRRYEDGTCNNGGKGNRQMDRIVQAIRRGGGIWMVLLAAIRGGEGKKVLVRREGAGTKNEER
jgi:hypothetical protein